VGHPHPASGAAAAGAGRRLLAGLNGAQIFHEMLLEEGVEVLFGYPGGAVIPIFDVLYDSPIRYVQTRHEQGAGHMADGYARSTGRVGTCIATSGPGATNLVTAWQRRTWTPCRSSRSRARSAAT